MRAGYMNVMMSLTRGYRGSGWLQSVLRRDHSHINLTWYAGTVYVEPKSPGKNYVLKFSTIDFHFLFCCSKFC